MATQELSFGIRLVREGQHTVNLPYPPLEVRENGNERTSPRTHAQFFAAGLSSNWNPFYRPCPD